MAQDVTVKIKFQLLQDIDKKLGFINKQFASLEQQTKNNVSAFNKMAIAVTGVNQGIELAKKGFNLAKNAVIPFINAASKIEDLSTQFVTLTGSIGNAQKLLKDLQRFSASTPFQIEGLAEASKKLLSFQFSQDEVLTRLQQLGDVAAASGNDINELALIFGQVNAAGKLTGERLLQFQERAVPIGPAIAKTMGVAESAVKDLVSQGKVTFEVFDEAFKSLSQEGGQFANGMIRQSKTLSGLLSTLNDNIFNVMASVGQSMLPAIKNATKTLIEFVQANQELIKTKSIDFMRGLAHSAGFLVKAFGGLMALWEGFKILLEGIVNIVLRVAKSFVGFASIVANLANKIPGVNFATDGLNETYNNLANAVEASNKGVSDQVDKFNETAISAEKAGNFVSQLGDNLGKIPATKTVDVKINKVDTEVNFADSIKASLSKSFEAITGSISLQSIAGALKGGAAGATALAKNIGNAIGAAFGVPGAGELVELLSLPPEKFKELIDQFFKAIPGIVNAIATNIPVLIQAFVDNVDPIIDAVVGAIPLIVQKLLELLVDPNFWVSVMGAFLSVLTLGILDSFKPVAEIFKYTGFAFKLAADVFQSAVGFFKGAVDTIKGIFENFSLGGILSGGGGGGIPIVSDVLGAFGFADGVDIPNLSKYRNDGFPASRLSAGEAVLDNPTTRKLNRYLDNTGSAQAMQPAVIEVKIGEDKLAEALVNLNLKGYRVA